MLKEGTKIVKRNGLNFVLETGDKPLRFKPWLGDALAFLYDTIMEKSVFPKKFAADIDEHYDILRQELKDVENRRVLELATGSGSAVNFLHPNNRYAGTDISPGLLGKATTKFRAAGFRDADFYLASASDLPFDDAMFDVCLCILSLNFFDDLAGVLREVNRVLAGDSLFLCCVPVPERNRLCRKIRGRLYSEEELRQTVENHGFRFNSIACENGALFYFRGVKTDEARTDSSTRHHRPPDRAPQGVARWRSV